MTPLPKRRWSSRRQGKKKATFKKQSQTRSRCGNCGEPKIAHQVCLKCGFYNGEQVIKIKEKKVKKPAEK